MTIDKDDLLKSILDSLSRIEHIQSDDIPNIDLYMDQVTTFMDQHLRATTRYPDEDKILTKTMINNYSKNALLPPSDKKKYSKDHIILLIYIYYLKNFLSISDRIAYTQCTVPCEGDGLVDITQRTYVSTYAVGKC